jgi:hypothetical protein
VEGEAAPARKPRGAAAKPATNGEADIISALEALKPLVATLGADRLKRLVDILG